MAIAALGLGGNIGEPKRYLSRALRDISLSPNVTVLDVSRLYSTPPWGELDQPDFLNACALIETSLGARDLLTYCLSVEAELGRIRDRRWGPRNIDIDILYYADLVVDEPALQLPHPRMTARGFVMIPLAEIAGEVEIDGQTVSHWAKDLSDETIKPITKNGNWWQLSD